MELFFEGFYFEMFLCKRLKFKGFIKIFMCLFFFFNLIDENMKLRKIFIFMEFFMVFLIRLNVNILGCNN